MIDIELPFVKHFAESDYKVTGSMIKSLIHRYTMQMGPTSLTYYMDKFTSNEEANAMLYKLHLEGIIKTEVTHNYTSLEINEKWLLKHYTKDELVATITEAKVNHFSPIKAESKQAVGPADQVSLTSGIKQSGLVRYGFMQAGRHKFKYDIPMMRKYRRYIIKFSVKSMEKMEAKLHRSLRLPEGYDYQSIIEDVINRIIIEGDIDYILGDLLLDSRGRAIYECLRNVFNPIANKMARALVIAPATSVTDEGLKNAYLCISEMLYGFNPNVNLKALKGLHASLNHEYADLDLTTEHGLDNMFENIWLERLYADIDAYRADNTHKVTTPIEVDFGSSNLVIIGLLLGHSSYVDSSKYMWEIDGMSKNHVKFAQTPYVFGSSASIPHLWTKNKLTFTPEQVRIMRHEQVKGKFAIANEFKDIIIKHCNPKASVKLQVGRENFTVECNKTRNVGETPHNYIVLDTEADKFKVITHTLTHKVPDLQSFRRYFVTGLIHNVDSQILDNICLRMDWILPIHDAGIVTWEGGTQMRDLAFIEMNDLRDDGRSIVYNYLKSINLDKSGFVKFAKLLAKIDAMHDNRIELSKYLLK